MLNQWVGIGRLARNWELKSLPNSETMVANTSIFIDRPYSKGKDRVSDVVNLVVYGKQAEFAAEYTGKGKITAIQGRLQIRSYDHKDGYKVYIAEIICDKVTPIEWADKGGSDFKPVDPIDTGNIPF